MDKWIGEEEFMRHLEKVEKMCMKMQEKQEKNARKGRRTIGKNKEGDGRG